VAGAARKVVIGKMKTKVIQTRMTMMIMAHRQGHRDLHVPLLHEAKMVVNMGAKASPRWIRNNSGVLRPWVVALVTVASRVVRRVAVAVAEVVAGREAAGALAAAVVAAASATN